MPIPSFLRNLFDSKAREKDALLKSVPENQRAALASVLDGQTDFRDHPELGGHRAVLRVKHPVGEVLADLHVSELPEDAVFVRPGFALSGLWPYYQIESTATPVKEPAVKQTIPLVLRNGDVRQLALAG